MPLIAHAPAALRNAFLSKGARRFGAAFCRDYLRMAARAARAWGSTAPGEMALLGFRVPYPNQSHALALLHEVFVNASYDFVARSPHPRIIDCGANIGMSVLYFKACAPGAVITAIEADPATFACLQRVVDLNRLRDVEAINAAVSSHDGEATLYSMPDDRGGISASVHPEWGGASATRVSAMRLSSIVTARIDFLKIDIEGAEYDAIDDLIATHRLEHVAETAIECHDVGGESAPRARLVRQLEEAGFHVATRDVDASRRVALVHAVRG